MTNNKRFLNSKKAGFVLGAVLLAAVTQYAGNAAAQSAEIRVTAPVLTQTVVPDDYVYYPRYGVYFSARRHQYYYLKGNSWVWAPQPEGVSVDVVLGSPSVRLDFHDSPEKHHREVLRKYPRNWAPHDDHHDKR